MLTGGTYGWLDGIKPYSLHAVLDTPPVDLAVPKVWEDTVLHYIPGVSAPYTGLEGIHVRVKNLSSVPLDSFHIQANLPDNVFRSSTGPCENVNNLRIDTVMIAPGDSADILIGDRTVYVTPSSGSYTYTVSAGSPNGFLDKHWADNVYTRTRSGILTGLDPMDMKEMVKVFPNPVMDDFLNIEMPCSDIAEWHILDLLGVSLMQGQLSGTLTSINLGILPPGMYIIWLKQGNYQKMIRFTLT